MKTSNESTSTSPQRKTRWHRRRSTIPTSRTRQLKCNQEFQQRLKSIIRINFKADGAELIHRRLITGSKVNEGGHIRSRNESLIKARLSTFYLFIIFFFDHLLSVHILLLFHSHATVKSTFFFFFFFKLTKAFKVQSDAVTGRPDVRLPLRCAALRFGFLFFFSSFLSFFLSFSFYVIIIQEVIQLLIFFVLLLHLRRGFMPSIIAILPKMIILLSYSGFFRSSSSVAFYCYRFFKYSFEITLIFRADWASSLSRADLEGGGRRGVGGGKSMDHLPSSAAWKCSNLFIRMFVPVLIKGRWRWGRRPGRWGPTGKADRPAMGCRAAEGLPGRRGLAGPAGTNRAVGGLPGRRGRWGQRPGWRGGGRDLSGGWGFAGPVRAMGTRARMTRPREGLTGRSGVCRAGEGDGGGGEDDGAAGGAPPPGALSIAAVLKRLNWGLRLVVSPLKPWD